MASETADVGGKDGFQREQPRVLVVRAEADDGASVGGAGECMKEEHREHRTLCLWLQREEDALASSTAFHPGNEGLNTANSFPAANRMAACCDIYKSCSSYRLESIGCKNANNTAAKVGANRAQLVDTAFHIQKQSKQGTVCKESEEPQNARQEKRTINIEGIFE